MCDPVTIIGLAASVVQIVDVTGRLISRSREIYGSVDGAFRENSELEVLITDLQKTNAKLARIPLQITDGDVIDHDDKALRQLCCGCNEVADEILDRLALLKFGDGGDNRKLASAKYAWRFMRSERELNALAVRVAAYREQLHSRILVSLTERFDGLQLTQTCRFDNLDRTGRDILDGIKHNRTHVTTEIGNQTDYLTRLANAHHEEIINKLSIIVETRSVSPNPFGSDDEAASQIIAENTINGMIEDGNYSAMHMHIRRQPDAIFETNTYGETPLHVAVRKGDLKATEYLIRKGANKNADDIYDQTPLHFAVKWNHVNILRLLISKGADPDLQDEHGNKPVDIADPDSEAAWVLTVGPGLEDVDGRGYTALRHFVKLGKLDIVSSLLDRGADIHVVCEDDEIKGNEAPLVDAGINEDFPMLQLLLDRGVDTDAQTNRSGAAIVSLAWHRKPTAVKFLVEHGADIEARNSVGFTALHESAFKGYPELVRLLIDHGADMEAHSNTQHTPLGLAVLEGHGSLEVVHTLLERGADVNTLSDNCNTPLHDSSEYGWAKATKLLLEYGARTEIGDAYRYTPLCRAARNGQMETMKLLLELGHADVDVNGRDGFTPLIEAAHHGHLEAVKLLVDAGADMAKAYAPGKTALVEAHDRGHPRVVQYLREKMTSQIQSGL